MTEKIILELTLKELQQIDKYIEVNDDTHSVLMKIKDAYPVFRSPAEEAYKDTYGNYPSGSPSEDVRWGAFLAGYQSTQPKAIPVEESPSTPMDEVVDRLVKKYQAQKLWNMVRDKLGYSIDLCDEIVDLVEKWLPKEQSAAGSQNVDTELLVDGHNHCLNKMKEMLR